MPEAHEIQCQHGQTISCARDFGSDTGYDLEVYRPNAAKPGFIKSKISDALDVGISGEISRSNIVNATAMITPGGYYLMCLPAGTCPGKPPPASPVA